MRNLTQHELKWLRFEKIQHKLNENNKNAMQTILFKFNRMVNMFFGTQMQGKQLTTHTAREV